MPDPESTPRLSFHIERFVVKQLACEGDPDQIAEKVQTKFLRDVSPETIRAYCPEADGSALTPELRDLYQVTHWDYVGVGGEPEP